MKKIGIFGGAFDPPHNGHLSTIDNLLSSGLIDQVWLVPASDDRYDKKPNATAVQRLDLVKALGAESIDPGRVRIETCQIEGKLPGSATIELLDYLSTSNPEHQYFFVIGADNVDISWWKEAKRLSKEATFIVVPRPGQLLTDLPKNMRTLDSSTVKSFDVSSSKVRESVAAGKAIDKLVPAAVANYIRSARLYL